MTKGLKTDESPPGGKLFSTGSDFYTWYMCWVKEPKTHAETFQALSELMRIGLLSSEGGLYLSKEEELTAEESICILKNELCDGSTKQTEVHNKLQQIANSLILNNPKAKLVAYATKLEYKYCILTPSSIKDKSLRSCLDKLVQTVTPSLLAVNAYAISQILSQTLEENPADPQEKLSKELKNWIEITE